MLPWEPQDPPADPRPACPGAAAAPSAAAPSPSPASKGLGKTPGSLKGIKPNRMFDREEILERRRTGSGHPPAKDARPGRDPQPDHLISPPRAPRQIHVRLGCDVLQALGLAFQLTCMRPAIDRAAEISQPQTSF